MSKRKRGAKMRKIEKKDRFSFVGPNSIATILSYLTFEDVFKNRLITINKMVFFTLRKHRRLMYGLLKNHFQLEAHFDKDTDYYDYYQCRNDLANAARIDSSNTDISEFNTFDVSDIPHFDDECGGCCKCVEDVENCGRCCGCRPIFYNFSHRNEGDFCCFCVTHRDEDLDENEARRMNHGLFSVDRKVRMDREDNVRKISTEFIWYSLEDFTYVYISVDLILPYHIYQRSKVVSWDDFSLEQNLYMIRIAVENEVIFLGLIHGMKEKYQFFRIKRIKEMIKERGWKVSHQSLIERLIQGSLLHDKLCRRTYGIDNVLEFIGNRNMSQNMSSNVFNYESILIYEISSKVCERYIELYIKNKAKENWLDFDRKFPYRQLFQSRLSFQSTKYIYNLKKKKKKKRKKKYENNNNNNHKTLEFLLSQLGLAIQVVEKRMCLFFLDKQILSLEYLFESIIPRIWRIKEQEEEEEERLVGEKNRKKVNLWKKRKKKKKSKRRKVCKKLVRQKNGVYKMK